MDEYKWWQRGVIYQVYPRSFQDSNGDGVGDLRGLIARLDYLAWLGVDAIWLSPIHPSPDKDFGYDVSDYTAIHPAFGTMAGFERLLEEAHARRLRVILDFVPNHTSDQHPWFAESRRSRASAKRDWYIWRDARPDGTPPNNWLSNFGGPAWTWDEATGQFYYHAFLREQPDLNWRNPDVQAAMLDVLRFWLDRDVDGFRVDVIWGLIKDEWFRDNPPNPDYHPSLPPHYEQLATYSADRPEVHDIIGRMRELLDRYDDRMMVGEIYLPLERLVTYYGSGGNGAHLPFNFQLIRMPWDAQAVASAVARYESLLPPHGWPNWVLGNHDKPRIASRVGAAQARVAALLLLTLRGTPTLYYGDELGMENVPIPPDRVRDPFERNVPGLGFGRDPVRTPMPWSPGPNAGFSTGTPWLPLAADAETRNVERQQDDPGSMLTLYKRLLDLRRREPALAVGSYRQLPAPPDVFAYAREHGGRRLLVALNFGSRPRAIDLNGGEPGTILLSTHGDRQGPAGARVELRGDEGVLLAPSP
ncbi:MAG TPA: alpha-amylase family glycosyl hydrolase [Vicinamibacterales bacterium]|nr:alpha-amylase family glycosyl hydrolase [Vicinamibacterales bacterium]